MRAVFCKIAIASNQVMVCLEYIKHTFVPLNDIEIKYIDKKIAKNLRCLFVISILLCYTNVALVMKILFYASRLPGLKQ